MTYRFCAIRCPALPNYSFLTLGEGRALRQARDAKLGRDPRTELEATGGRSGAGFEACPFLRGGAEPGGRVPQRAGFGPRRPPRRRRLSEHTAGWQKRGQGLPAAYSGAGALPPAYGIKRKAAPRAAATSGPTQRGTRGGDFRTRGWEIFLQRFLWGTAAWARTSPEGSGKPATP